MLKVFVLGLGLSIGPSFPEAIAGELGAGAFRLADAGETPEGGTRYLVTAGEPAKRCAFEIVLGKPVTSTGGVFAVSPATLARRPHSDCTVFLQGLARELGFTGRLPAPARKSRLTGSVVVLGSEQSRSPTGSFSAKPPGPWITTKLFLADGSGEVFLNLDARHGIGEFALKDEEYARVVTTELAKLLLPQPGSTVLGRGKPWEALTRAERKAMMKRVVVPQMSAVFKELDAQRFTTIDCTLCHGEGAKRGTFEMPNPSLPALDFGNRLQKERAEHPVTTKFMFKRVVPEMILALAAVPFDTKTGQGFGCGSCHIVKN